MLPFVATVLLCLAALGCILHAWAAARLARFEAEPGPGNEAFPPLTFWRALKPGVPDLDAKLDALANAAQPGDQLLIGVDRNSPDREICARWRARHPEREIAIVECEPQHAQNPKISKFRQMRASARHPEWLLTDSEAMLTQETANALRHEWLRSGADALTAGYRFTGMNTAAQWLDTLPAALTLWPGLMLVPRLTFTLGACTALRAADLDAIGGWAALGNHLAEDHELGQRLAAQGKTIALSRSILDLEADPLRGGDYLRHQHRLAVTYRAANPAGFSGLPIFHALPLAAAAVLLVPALWPCAAACAGARIATAFAEAKALRMRHGAGLLLLPLVPLLESLFWLVAWLPLPVWWAGRWRRISWRGEFL